MQKEIKNSTRMNKPTPTNNTLKTSLIIAAGVIILAGVVGFAVSSNMKMEEQKKKDADSAMMMKKEGEVMMSKSSDAMMSKDGDTMMKKEGEAMTTMSKVGDYKPYAASELVHAKEGHHVVIFFNASWCPTCQATVKDIEANKDKIGQNIHILSADFDKETALKQKYGVTMQHTFVEVDAKGELIKKTTGLNTVAAINEYLK
jgi:thiol-disulfide isomerase/thioredoxin/preprotein translocase subunit Sss1